MTKITDLLIMSESELREHIVRALISANIEFKITPDYIVTVSDDIRPLVCIHTDTVGNNNPRTLLELNTLSPDKISLWPFSTASVLGSDDRSGCWIALEMIKRGTSTPFNYGFFCQEEAGCVGSSKFAVTESLDVYSAFIGLDRACRNGKQNTAVYGYDNDELIKIFTDLGYAEQCGSFTDCSVLSSYTDLACVNLSTGFLHEHTKFETLNLRQMEETLQVMLNVVIPDQIYDAKPVITKYGKSWPVWVYDDDEEFESYHGNYRRRSSDNILDADVTEIYPDDGLAIKICCDFCSEFAPLYEIHGSLVCESCLPLVR